MRSSARRSVVGLNRLRATAKRRKSSSVIGMIKICRATDVARVRLGSYSCDPPDSRRTRRGDDMIRGLLLRVLLMLAVASVRVAAQTLTFTNTTIVDVSDGTLRRGMTVVVEGNRIASVGPSPATSPRRGQVIDAKGMYMIPGLWDMHTHAYFDGPRSIGDSVFLPLLVVN